MKMEEEEMEHCYNIPQLMSSLKSSFRPRDFKIVEMILISREEQMKIDKQIADLKTQSERFRCEQMEKLVFDLEKELGVYQDKCEELSKELEKNKLVSTQLIESQAELLQKVPCFIEDNKIIGEKVRMEQERADGYWKRLVELKMKNKEFENAKRTAEEEVWMWKKRCEELGTRIVELEQDYDVLVRRESKELSGMISNGKNEIDNGDAVWDVNLPYSIDNEIKNTMNFDERVDVISFEYIDEDSESVFYCTESGVVHFMLGNPREKGPDQDLSSVYLLSKPLINAKEENKCSSSKSGYAGRVGKQTSLELEERSNEILASSKLGIATPAYEDFIDISDSDDETEFNAERPSHGRGNDMFTMKTSYKNCQKTRVNNLECSPLASGQSRGPAPILLISDSDDEDYYKPPNKKLKKKQDSVVGVHAHLVSSTDGCLPSSTVSPWSKGVGQMIPTSMKMPIPLRQCREVKVNGAENIPSNHFKMNGISSEKFGIQLLILPMRKMQKMWAQIVGGFRSGNGSLVHLIS